MYATKQSDFTYIMTTERILSSKVSVKCNSYDVYTHYTDFSFNEISVFAMTRSPESYIFYFSSVNNKLYTYLFYTAQYIWYIAVVKRVIITPPLHNNICTCFKKLP